MPQPYVYRRLNKDRKEIRLLTLEPGSGDDVIRCTLRHTFIDERPFPDYETISYVCGDPEEKRHIKLHGSPASFPANSEIVLRRMRLPASKRTLWLDAVCIDQDDVAERGHQVGMMCDIYTNTFRNLIWLGPDDGHTEQAIVEIRAVLQEITEECNGLENLGSILRNEGGAPLFSRTGMSSMALSSQSSLLYFFRSTWFRRLWVVQEASLAPTSVFHRGRFEIPALDVFRTAAWISYKWYALSSESREVISHHASYAFDFVDREHGFFWRFAKYSRFEHLLTNLVYFETFEPHDHVFAILGLWRQQSGSTEPIELLSPDYSLDVCTVFRNATRYAIHTSGSLWSLKYVSEVHHDFGKWPSWVPRWDHVYDTATDLEPWRDIFPTFTGVSVSSVDFQDRPDSLCVRGLVIAEVAKVLPAIESGMDVRTFLALFAEMEALRCSNAYSTDPTGNIEAKVASALMGGVAKTVDPTNDSEALEGYRAYKQYLEAQQGWPPLACELEHTATDQEKLAAQFRQDSAIAGRRAVFNTDDGHIGLGPRTAQPGDVLVVLFGLNLPAILRRHEKNASFYFVGLSYVYGIMDGEAIREFVLRGSKSTLFCIV